MIGWNTIRSRDGEFMGFQADVIPAAAEPTLTLPIEMDPDRKWWVGETGGDVFDADVDFDGITVTIELRTPAEARAVATLLADLTFKETPR